MYGLPEDLDLSFALDPGVHVEWSNGAALEVDDDSDRYESSTITNADGLIVV